MTYPPHGYQQQPHAYAPPPQPYAYTPQQPVWGPPQPPPPVDRRLERGRKVQKFLRNTILIAAAVGAAWAGIYYGLIWTGAPAKGDCLSSFVEEFDGWQYVECDDPTAGYKIVELVKGPKYDSDLESCEGYPTGMPISLGTSRRSSSRTEMCLVPSEDLP